MTESQAQSPSHLYKGNCHCGRFRYTVAIPEPLESTTVLSCNCSICTKNGYLNIYPKIPDVVFTHGSLGELSEYRSATKSRPHKFCPDCGSSVMIELENGETHHLRENVAVNVRTLENIEDIIDKLQIKRVNGKDMGEKYSLPPV